MVDQSWLKIFFRALTSEIPVEIFSEIWRQDYQVGWKFFLRSQWWNRIGWKFFSDLDGKTGLVENFLEISDVRATGWNFSVRSRWWTGLVEIFDESSDVRATGWNFSVRSRWWTGLVENFHEDLMWVTVSRNFSRELWHWGLLVRDFLQISMVEHGWTKVRSGIHHRDLEKIF